MINGATECAEMFRQLEEAVQLKIVRREARNGAQLILNDQLLHVARRTENLASSLAIRTKKETPTSVRLTIGPSSKRFYFLFLEYGTKFITRRPILAPSVAAKGDEAAAVFANGLWAEVRKRFKSG